MKWKLRPSEAAPLDRPRAARARANGFAVAAQPSSLRSIIWAATPNSRDPRPIWMSGAELNSGRLIEPGRDQRGGRLEMRKVKCLLPMSGGLAMAGAAEDCRHQCDDHNWSNWDFGALTDR